MRFTLKFISNRFHWWHCKLINGNLWWIWCLLSVCSWIIFSTFWSTGAILEARISSAWLLYSMFWLQCIWRCHLCHGWNAYNQYQSCRNYNDSETPWKNQLNKSYTMVNFIWLVCKSFHCAKGHFWTFFVFFWYRIEVFYLRYVLVNCCLSSYEEITEGRT